MRILMTIIWPKNYQYKPNRSGCAGYENNLQMTPLSLGRLSDVYVHEYSREDTLNNPVLRGTDDVERNPGPAFVVTALALLPARLATARNSWLRVACMVWV